MIRLLSAFILISVLCGLFVGPILSRSDQRSLALALVSTSSILFGILGIWAGLVFPEILQVFRKDKDKASILNSLSSGIGLFKAVMLALLTFGCSSVYVYCGDIIYRIPFVREASFILRMVSASILIFLVFVNVYTLFLVMRPGAELLHLVMSKANKAMSAHEALSPHPLAEKETDPPD